METQQIEYVHQYVSDRKTFDEMKATQIQVGQEVRLWRTTYKQYQREGRQWLTMVKDDKGVRWVAPVPQVSTNPRLHNVAYALVRGKRYAQIESKFLDRDGLRTHPLTRGEIESYLLRYPGVDTSRINWEGM